MNAKAFPILEWAQELVEAAANGVKTYWDGAAVKWAYAYETEAILIYREATGR